jgi:hypothetical protein
MESEAEGREGVLGSSVGRGGGVRRESEAAYGDGEVREDRLSMEILSYCKGNCGCRVRLRKREALAGDPK